jgi:hypothetical protein
MLFKLFLSDIGISNNLWLLIGFFVSVIGMLLIGYLDTRLGIRSREMENNSLKNPVLVDILASLKRIENESINRV